MTPGILRCVLLDYVSIYHYKTTLTTSVCPCLVHKVTTLNRELWGPVPDMCISYVHIAQREPNQTADLPLSSYVYN